MHYIKSYCSQALANLIWGRYFIGQASRTTRHTRTQTSSQHRGKAGDTGDSRRPNAQRQGAASAAWRGSLVESHDSVHFTRKACSTLITDHQCWRQSALGEFLAYRLHTNHKGPRTWPSRKPSWQHSDT